ncbi:hypothetical protein LC653_12705 [Nostoc sp. CHAB 5784]|uniref:hypothetical protein n=1 Tax=Nostoc mirabile TaxID=2907820 RepID=UPI001E380002|nr:hypothetical protein [Nostoc mirabile]MCC5664757.1 hypothetical protein [Nostoc mirabile CHAB5784]
MTTDRLETIEEILAQITTLVGESAVAIAELRSSIEQTRQNNAVENGELTSRVNSLVQKVEVHQRNHEVSQRNIEVIISEIRVLRTKSQRILEHLFGREENRE